MAYEVITLHIHSRYVLNPMTEYTSESGSLKWSRRSVGLNTELVYHKTSLAAAEEKRARVLKVETSREEKGVADIWRHKMCPSFDTLKAI